MSLALAATFSLSPAISAQTPSPGPRPGTEPANTQSGPAAQQVITILHRINGFKMLRLLIRSGEKLDAVDSMAQAFEMAGQVHTSIIAGLTLDDGETVAAWLPEAEIEAESASSRSTMPGTIAPFVVGVPSFKGAVTALERPDITIIRRDGTRQQARYVGLDGITGMSLLKLPEKSFPTPPEAKDLQLLVGQRMRLLSPEPVPETGAIRSDAIYVRIGETEAQIVGLEMGISGTINRIKIRSGKLSPLNIGGVAVSDEGQTIGIVESIDGTEGNVLPAGVIRAAARRVLERQTSVPRPWLGVSGEPVASTSLDQIVREGWDKRRAQSLIENQLGILLTSVAPGSPADVAALREGDVIVSVNNSDVKSSDDFTLLLSEAAGAPLHFAVVRPGNRTAESVTVKLVESSDPSSTFNNRMRRSSPLIAQGIETVQLRTAIRTGRSGGLLVVYVQPGSAALKAGLLPGDVIEAIDGRRILPVTAMTKVAPVARTSVSRRSPVSPVLEPLGNPRYTLSVLRNKEKLQISVVAREQ